MSLASRKINGRLENESRSCVDTLAKITKREPLEGREGTDEIGAYLYQGHAQLCERKG